MVSEVFANVEAQLAHRTVADDQCLSKCFVQHAMQHIPRQYVLLM